MDIMLEVIASNEGEQPTVVKALLLEEAKCLFAQAWAQAFELGKVLLHIMPFLLKRCFAIQPTFVVMSEPEFFGEVFHNHYRESLASI